MMHESGDINNIPPGSKRNFIIRYKIDTKGYYLKDAGEGSGTFVRIDRPLILSNGFLISFGESHLVVQI